MHSRFTLSPRLLAATLVFATLGGAFAHSAPRRPDVGLPVVVEGSHVTKSPSGGYEAAFGTLVLLDSPTATCSMMLRNAGRRPVRIEDVTTSCGCTTVVLTGPGASVVSMPLLLAPGAAAKLVATVDGGRLMPGRIRKGVFVHSDSGDLYIALTGIGVGPARLSVDTVDFGKVSAGQTVRRRVDIDLDPRVASMPLRLVSNDPDVVVDPAECAPGSARRSFTIGVADSPRLGPVDATVTLLPDDASGGYDRGFPMTFLPVTAEIVADIDVLPVEVGFGLVRAGDAPSKSVRLSGPGVRGGCLRLTCDRPYLRARLEEARGGAGSIVIGLAATAPAGKIDGRVLIETPKGARFSIPVSGTVAVLPRDNIR